MNKTGQLVFCLYLFLAACASRTPKCPGIPGQPLDVIMKQIQEHDGRTDTMAHTKGPCFDVYMTPLPDEDGTLCDEGIVTLSPETL